MSTPTPDQILAVRREAIGDSTDTATLPDADIVYYWDPCGQGDVTLTAACCCDMLANRSVGAATSIGFTAGDITIRPVDRRSGYSYAAEALRRRYYGSGTITLTRPEDEGDDTEYSP